MHFDKPQSGSFRLSEGKKLYGKLYFHAKDRKNNSDTETKPSEIRKVALPKSFDEFYETVMLSLIHRTNQKQNLSDSLVDSLRQQNTVSNCLTLKYKDINSEKWKRFNDQKSYENAILKTLNETNRVLKIKVFYKKSMFKQGSSSSRPVHRDSYNLDHHLTICTDLSQIQLLIEKQKATQQRTEESGNTMTLSASKDHDLFHFWLDSKA